MQESLISWQSKCFTPKHPVCDSEGELCVVCRNSSLEEVTSKGRLELAKKMGKRKKHIASREKSVHKGLQKARGTLERRPERLDHVLFSPAASLKSVHGTFQVLSM